VDARGPPSPGLTYTETRTRKGRTMRTVDTWHVCDGMGEWVEYYNPTGHVMHFTRDREKSRRTTDSYEAAEIARIAREVYRRRNMEFSIVLD
jgi:hypothetical protein